MIKVIVNNSATTSCPNCQCVYNVTLDEQLYDDEYIVNDFRLMHELGLHKIIPVLEPKVFEANLILEQVNNALKELSTNRDAYSDLQKLIHPTTVFLWGLRITLEEYPNSIVKFIKPF